MITTVTISSVTTVTAIIGFGMTAGLVAIITLIAFLGVKELANADGNGTQRLLAKSLDIGIIPLTILFVMITATRIVAILA